MFRREAEVAEFRDPLTRYFGFFATTLPDVLSIITLRADCWVPVG